MSITIKNQKFGTEIEMTGITRKMAAKVVADYYNTSVQYQGGSYDTYAATDTKGRTWKFMTDGSITTQCRRGIAAGRDYSTEMVTPILQYEDLEDLQEIIRALVKKGAFVNNSCGMHVHVDGANHTGESLARLLEVAVGRQELFNEALDNNYRARWCQNINRKLLATLKAKPITDITKTDIYNAWYSTANDNYRGSWNNDHYNTTRYHGINLHAFFNKGTVEFRLFNSTLHAGKVKAYIQFSLAMSAWAIDQAKAGNPKWSFFKSTAGMTKEAKGKLMKSFLENRLGLTGKEFKTARLHLTSQFTGSTETEERVSA